MALRVTWASVAFPSRTSVTVGDTDQSSKQMLVCPVLRGNAGWKPSSETGSKAAMLFLATEMHWEKTEPRKTYGTVLKINHD